VNWLVFFEVWISIIVGLIIVVLVIGWIVFWFSFIQRWGGVVVFVSFITVIAVAARMGERV